MLRQQCMEYVDKVWRNRGRFKKLGPLAQAAGLLSHNDFLLTARSQRTCVSAMLDNSSMAYLLELHSRILKDAIETADETVIILGEADLVALTKAKGSLAEPVHLDDMAGFNRQVLYEIRDTKSLIESVNEHLRDSGMAEVPVALLKGYPLLAGKEASHAKEFGTLTYPWDSEQLCILKAAPATALPRALDLLYKCAVQQWQPFGSSLDVFNALLDDESAKVLKVLLDGLSTPVGDPDGDSLDDFEKRFHAVSRECAPTLAPVLCPCRTIVAVLAVVFMFNGHLRCSMAILL